MPKVTITIDKKYCFESIELMEEANINCPCFSMQEGVGFCGLYPNADLENDAEG